MKNKKFILLSLLAVLFGIGLAATAAGAVRPDMLIALIVVLLIPIRSVGKQGEKVYSAMLYRIISGPGGREVQLYPKNFEPLER